MSGGVTHFMWKTLRHPSSSQMRRRPPTPQAKHSLSWPSSDSSAPSCPRTLPSPSASPRKPGTNASTALRSRFDARRDSSALAMAAAAAPRVDRDAGEVDATAAEAAPLLVFGKISLAAASSSAPAARFSAPFSAPLLVVDAAAPAAARLDKTALLLSKSPPDGEEDGERGGEAAVRRLEAPLAASA